MRTARVAVKVTNGAVELQLPTNESMDLILKAVPQSLAEEIVKAAENAETASEPAAQETVEETAQETIEAELETATEESAEVSAKQYVDLKQIDAAEKVTMRAIKTAVQKSVKKVDSIDKGFLETPLADTTVKLAVGPSTLHNYETYTDSSTDPQACAAIDRQPRSRPRNLIRNHHVRRLPCPQVQAGTQEASSDSAAEEAERGSAQRDCPRIQANTNSQAQRGRQMEADRGGADQQEPPRHWYQVPKRKDHLPNLVEKVVEEQRKLLRHWDSGLHCIGSLRAMLLEGKSSRRCSVACGHRGVASCHDERGVLCARRSHVSPVVRSGGKFV